MKRKKRKDLEQSFDWLGNAELKRWLRRNPGASSRDLADAYPKMTLEEATMRLEYLCDIGAAARTMGYYWRIVTNGLVTNGLRAF